jgi:hypothetical protein
MLDYVGTRFEEGVLTQSTQYCAVVETNFVVPGGDRQYVEVWFSIDYYHNPPVRGRVTTGLSELDKVLECGINPRDSSMLASFEAAYGAVSKRRSIDEKE